MVMKTLFKFEEAGVKEAQNAAFVLVAGGLGERLGYNGIKEKVACLEDNDARLASWTRKTNFRVQLDPYIEELKKTGVFMWMKVQIKEFVNPNPFGYYTFFLQITKMPAKLSFKSSTSDWKCMMQGLSQNTAFHQSKKLLLDFDTVMEIHGLSYCTCEEQHVRMLSQVVLGAQFASQRASEFHFSLEELGSSVGMSCALSFDEFSLFYDSITKQAAMIPANDEKSKKASRRSGRPQQGGM
ncbi:hypothetical protein NC651_004687 [Populus alba x Populus x berolinensis]|nr:hypothetical protein NC651_004687 [Populus alba x Populus x berolinensis]